MNWDDVRFFLLVARTRTLSAAAKQLGVTQPTAGRRIAALERRLGTKLFVRGPGGFRLTRSGAHALEHAERIEGDVLALQRRVMGRDEGVRGSVRITASEWLVTSVLSPSIAALVERFPELTVELFADVRHLDLGRREADIALRPRRFDRDAIFQRAVAKISFGLYASSEYLSRHPDNLLSGGEGHVLATMSEGVGDVAGDWLDRALPNARRAVRVNGRDAMAALAAHGAALVCLARAVGDRIAGLSLVELAAPPPSATLWMGVHRDVRDIPRVRAVSDHLVEQVRERLSSPSRT